MRHLSNVCGIATAAIALATVVPSAVAQEITSTYTCQEVGTAPPKSLRRSRGACDLSIAGKLSRGTQARLPAAS